jgi:hypothetical protein
VERLPIQGLGLLIHEQDLVLVLLGRPEVCPEGCRDLLDRILDPVEGFPDVFPEGGRELVEDQIEDILLSPDVAVEAAQAQAGLFRDLADRGPVIASLDEDPAGSLEDLLVPLGHQLTVPDHRLDAPSRCASHRGGPATRHQRSTLVSPSWRK